MKLLAFAHENGLSATRALVREEQKRLGQFMTPPAIARVMAQRACASLNPDLVRVLEPAAGSGVLAAAVLELLLEREVRPQRVELVMCELDARLAPALRRLAHRMRRAGAAAGVSVSISVRIGDFLLSDLSSESPRFDVVIANPPYFKINKGDPRSQRHAYAVYGQPNIYGLFMAACSRVLATNGRWCFITPRSWTNGRYFVATRREMLRFLHIDAIHIFESREAHFADDEVLQEAMITWATARADTGSTITVSTSEGVRDLQQAVLRLLPIRDIIGPSAESVIFVPRMNDSAPLPDFRANLATYGLKVSTGPVVAFRATRHIAQAPRKGTVPFLWMQHIRPMRITWPIQKKREHIAANASTAWMMVPNTNMVITRRFSPKEDERRIIAAPYLGGNLPGPVLGLENHTNYLYRAGGELMPEEARGLAAFLNSRLVDQYLRTVAGNTQVNAADLRALPLPPMGDLVRIGRALSDGCTLADADQAVDLVLGVRQPARAA